MYEILIVVYLLVAMALIGLVLIQHGKGADALDSPQDPGPQGLI